ncbi:MAG: Spo0E family sporulation regulatory protein-aspartic acid phosphatase [Firmicutes bacterium]|nr:Spo0E family sporulation regulatory protein-aspartic acid phosphatase [Bacillota bacterium]
MNLSELGRLIKEKKTDLYLRYREQGTSIEVLRISEELDTLIYEYYLLRFPKYIKKELPQELNLKQSKG